MLLSKNKDTNKHTNKNTNKDTNKHIYIINDINNQDDISEYYGYEIFMLIYAIYLYNLYNDNENDNKNDNKNKNDDDENDKCIINFVFNDEFDLNNNVSISKIFFDSNKKVNFISLEKYNKLLNDKHITITNLQVLDLNDLPKYNNLSIHTKINNIFNLTYNMYKSFDLNDKNIFKNINENLITDDRLFVLKKFKYSVIYVLYNNKLSYINKYKNDTKILYTPTYYLNMIFNTLTNTNFIIIITDNEKLIKENIINKLRNKDKIFIINTHIINNLYLLLNANEIVLEIDPLCFSGSYFNTQGKCYLNLINRVDKTLNINIEKSISDEWTLSHDKSYILNYDSYLLKLLFNTIKHKDYYYSNNENLEQINKLNIVYKHDNKINIKYNHYIFILYEKQYIYNKLRSEIHIANKINKLDIEIYFESILKINNAKYCLYITDDIYSNFISRLQNFDNIKIYKYYVNDDNIYILLKRNVINCEHYINLIFDLNRIYSLLNINLIDSLILFPIKSNHSVDYDFIYDYYIFYINKILNKIKNLKLLVIAYSPSLILPFTINTLINIANHSLKYDIINIFRDYVIIIFYNIKNYNININLIEHKFTKFLSNILSLSIDEFIEDIYYSQKLKNSIGSSYYIKFNDKNNKDNRYKINNNLKFKINIINFPIKVVNIAFTNKLLIYIYELYDYKFEQIKLFTYDNLLKRNYKLLNYFIKLKKSEKKSLKLIKQQISKKSKKYTYNHTNIHTKKNNA
jgi:hypothetical protein